MYDKKERMKKTAGASAELSEVSGESMEPARKLAMKEGKRTSPEIPSPEVHFLDEHKPMPMDINKAPADLVDRLKSKHENLTISIPPEAGKMPYMLPSASVASRSVASPMAALASGIIANF